PHFAAVDHHIMRVAFSLDLDLAKFDQSRLHISMFRGLQLQGKRGCNEQRNRLREILQPITSGYDLRLRRGWQRDCDARAQGRFATQKRTTTDSVLTLSRSLQFLVLVK